MRPAENSGVGRCGPRFRTGAGRGGLRGASATPQPPAARAAARPGRRLPADARSARRPVDVTPDHPLRAGRTLPHPHVHAVLVARPVNLAKLHDLVASARHFARTGVSDVMLPDLVVVAAATAAKTAAAAGAAESRHLELRATAAADPYPIATRVRPPRSKQARTSSSLTPSVPGCTTRTTALAVPRSFSSSTPRPVRPFSSRSGRVARMAPRSPSK